MNAENHYKVLIIGAGCAGWTAAIYASRADLAPIVFEGEQPGGQLTITTEVENYPGFIDGIMGPELMENMKKQAARFGTKIASEKVEKIDFSSRPFKIEAPSGVYTADSVIVATGATAKLLNIESEKRLMGHGVSACAVCDGFFFKGKEVVIIGGGDSSMEEANFLTKFCSKVTVVHRRDHLRASKIMQQKAFDNNKIEFIWNSAIEEIIGEPGKGVRAVMIKDVVTGKVQEFATQGVFVAIGHQPNTKLFEGQLELNEKGYIVTKPDCMATSVEGVFAAGDVQDFVYRQAITAAGSGCMSALEAERFLESAVHA